MRDWGEFVGRNGAGVGTWQGTGWSGAGLGRDAGGAGK